MQDIEANALDRLAIKPSVLLQMQIRHMKRWISSIPRILDKINKSLKIQYFNPPNYAKMNGYFFANHVCLVLGIVIFWTEGNYSFNSSKSFFNWFCIDINSSNSFCSSFRIFFLLLCRCFLDYIISARKWFGSSTYPVLQWKDRLCEIFDWRCFFRCSNLDLYHANW